MQLIGDADLEHFGIKGMRWGERRYQNPDGSLTSAGRSRYMGSGSGRFNWGEPAAKARSALSKADITAQRVFHRVDAVKSRYKGLNSAAKTAVALSKKAGKKVQAHKAKVSKPKTEKEVKRQRATRKALIAAAGIGIAAVGAYAATKKVKSMATQKVWKEITLAPLPKGHENWSRAMTLNYADSRQSHATNLTRNMKLGTAVKIMRGKYKPWKY
jgi:hypothetical protein